MPVSITFSDNILADVRSRNLDDPDHCKREIRRRSCSARSLDRISAAASLIVGVIRPLQKEQMHQAVLKDDSIRDPEGVPVLVSWGYFQSIIPRTPGSTLCFRKRKRKRADESISAEKGRAFAYASSLEN